MSSQKNTNAQINRLQWQILYNATTTLTSALELDQVLERILAQLKQVVEHDSACIFFTEEDTLLAIAARGFPDLSVVLDKRYPASNPLFNEIITTKKPLILNDVQRETRFEGWGNTSEIRSWMGVPLVTSNGVIGCLTLDSYQEDAFDEDGARLTQIFATQAAIAIENARLYRNARDFSTRQRVLHQVSQEIIRTGADLDQLYSRIHRAASKLMPTDAFVISILDEDTDMIEAAYLWEHNERHESRHLPRGSGLSGYVIETGEPILAYDYIEQVEYRAMDVVHFGSGEQVRSLLAVPMRLGERVIGMLSAQSYRTHHYTAADQEILDMLAAYAAIAIDNARLFREIQKLAITDSLTESYNRRYFFDVAQREIARSRRDGHPFSILMFDIDGYKELNDIYGHDVGDDALRKIAECCRGQLRKTDVFARYGGDEFIILFPETTPQQCREIAERLRISLASRPIQCNEHALNISISVGIAGAQEDIPDIGTLVRCADQALYQAKNAGRNRVRVGKCD